MSITIDRTTFASNLEFASTALSPHNFVPVLNHFCFTEDGWLEAYDGAMAVRVFTDYDFVGALPGNQILKIVKSFKDKTVSIGEGRGELEVVIKSGRSNIKLQMLPEDDFVYNAPDPDNADVIFEADDSFLLALKSVLAAVGNDPSRPEQLGITLEGSEYGIALYATDNLTISSYVLSDYEAEEGEFPESMTIPTSFCNQLLSLSRQFPKDVITCYIFDGAILAVVEDQAEVFSQLIDNPKPVDLGGMVESYLEQSDDNFCPIPEGLASAMDRASIILESNDDSVATFSLDGDTMGVLAKSSSAKVEDDLNMDSDFGDFEFKGDPVLINRAISLSDSVCFLEDAVLFAKGENFIHMVSHSTEV